MDITAQNLNGLSVGFRHNYEAGVSEVEPTWSTVAEEVPSTTAENEYGWLNEWPSLREWIGDRVIKELSGDSYKIRNKKFESTVAVIADHIDDDNIGMYAPRFKGMGRATARWTDEMVWPALARGFDLACYDGQSFFDTDHPVGDAEDGAVKTVSNMQAGPNAPWFLLDTKQALKPLILQMRQKPKFNALTNADASERVFMKDQYVYGVKARANVGYGFWQMAFGSKAELNEANLKAAISSMKALENDRGGKLAIMPNLLVVGSSNEWKAKELLKNSRKQNGEDNVLKGSLELHVSAYLS